MGATTTHTSTSSEWSLQRLLESTENDTETYSHVTLKLTDVPSFEILSKVFNILEKEGTIEIPIESASPDSVAVDTVIKNCCYAGFHQYTTIPSQSESTKVVALKPMWNHGVGHKLADTDSPPLLGELRYEPLGQGKDSCADKARACPNCTCGRAEMEAVYGASEAKKRSENSKNMTSSCGNCYLGDAYRCAGCPHRGQPAFEPGDKVRLSDTVSQLMAPQSENAPIITSTGNIVKLNLT